jgi:CheY-like chemotaxis protein
LPLDPSRTVKEVIRLLRPSLPSTIAIIQRIEPARPILADPTQMHQVLMNLCTNAFHAMEQTGGVLEITLDSRELTAADLGSGREFCPAALRCSLLAIPARASPRRFRGGSSIPISPPKMSAGNRHGPFDRPWHRCEYGGFVTCESEPGKGATFRICLPISEAQAALEAADCEAVVTGRGRILLVDDEILLAEMGQIMLERLGYEVTVHTSSFDALAAFENEPDRFDAVLTDQTMPGITGVDLAQRMLRFVPTCRSSSAPDTATWSTKPRPKSMGSENLR